jgi:molecular chaperone DnaK
MADEIAIGIDLGTSYSCVSIVEGGQPVVLPNEWGEVTHASVVSFLEDGAVLVGNTAKRNIITRAESTVYSAKRLIGRYFFSDEVKKAMAVMPYKIVEGDNNSVRIEVANCIYSLPEISALVLKEMKAIADQYLGRPVTKAVITVPAYFNDNQRQATKDAGRIAGLNVLRILNEPTAAALAYGFGRDVNQRVVIYDLGGGTFDVSILEIGKDVFEVLATAGDTYLGGDDFDDRIMTWLADDFLARTRLDLRQSKYCLQMLKEAAEQDHYLAPHRLRENMPDTNGWVRLQSLGTDQPDGPGAAFRSDEALRARVTAGNRRMMGWAGVTGCPSSAW